jgi:hypothetical protein
MSKKTDTDNVVAFPTPEDEVSVSPKVETTPSHTVSGHQLMAIVVEDHGLCAPRKPPAIIEAEDYAAYSKQLDAIPPVGDDVILADHARMIRLLGNRVIGDLIEIGRRLVDARDNRCKHGEWLQWLEREFGDWSRQTADNYIHVFESFGQIANRVGNLNIDCRSLYMLAAPSTPEAARDEVIERSEAGERMTPAQIKEIVDKAVNAEIEPKLEALRAEAFQREAELRAEYEGAGRAKIDKAVNKATVPLQKQIQKYEERLAKIKSATRPAPHVPGLELIRNRRQATAPILPRAPPPWRRHMQPMTARARRTLSLPRNPTQSRPQSRSQPPPHTRSPRTALAIPKPPK